MPQLKIKMVRWEAEIAIGAITRDQKRKLDTYCEENDECPESIWYGEQEVMEEIVGKSYWDEVDDMFHETGFVFNDEDDLKITLEDAKISLDGEDIDFDASKVKKRFNDPKPFPKIDNNDNVAVLSGYAGKGIYVYELEIEDDFDESKLVLHFYDLKNFPTDRFLLDYLEYNGQEMNRDDFVTTPKIEFDLIFFE